LSFFLELAPSPPTSFSLQLFIRRPPDFVIPPPQLSLFTSSSLSCPSFRFCFLSFPFSLGQSHGFLSRTQHIFFFPLLIGNSFCDFPSFTITSPLCKFDLPGVLRLFFSFFPTVFPYFLLFGWCDFSPCLLDFSQNPFLRGSSGCFELSFPPFPPPGPNQPSQPGPSPSPFSFIVSRRSPCPETILFSFFTPWFCSLCVYPNVVVNSPVF